MLRYILRRVLNAIPLLFLITIITYLVINLAPGDPVRMFINPEAKTQIDPAVLKAQWGLDKPFLVRYLIWLGNVLRGDLGMSFFHGRPVMEVLRDALPNTILLSLSSLVLSLTIAVPIGIYSAVKRNSVFDYIFSTFSFLGVSIPGFWLGLMCILFFALKLQWFPTSGMREVYDHVDLLDRLRHLVLPTIVLGTGTMAGDMRYMRSAMLNAITQDFVRTARAKGASEHRVILKHALRNALLPMATSIGFMIPSLFSGAAAVEILFAWPGLGRVLMQANFTRDYPIIMGELILFSLMVIVGSLASDVLYAIVDPRIKLD